ncbi:hypothetical protein ACOSQ3_008113 [Xanthoceras sorbifolium]
MFVWRACENWLPVNLAHRHDPVDLCCSNCHQNVESTLHADAICKPNYSGKTKKENQPGPTLPSCTSSLKFYRSRSKHYNLYLIRLGIQYQPVSVASTTESPIWFSSYFFVKSLYTKLLSLIKQIKKKK